jgi:hypothetical protein
LGFNYCPYGERVERRLLVSATPTIPAVSTTVLMGKGLKILDGLKGALLSRQVMFRCY